MRQTPKGFTLVELMIVVAIIGILAAIGVTSYGNAVRKSAEAVTKGNLGALRSALSIYYGNTEAYPTDNLASVTRGLGYLVTIPVTRTKEHSEVILVTAETAVTDSGGWSYNNAETSQGWGAVHVGCLHQDLMGKTWTAY